MRLLILSLLAASFAFFVCGCAGSGGPLVNEPAAQASPLSFPLPDPQSLPPLGVEPRRSSYTENDLVKLGKDFDGGLPSDNVVVIGNSVEFHASWNPGQGVSGLGYCIYAFNIPGYDRAPEIYTTMSVAPQSTGSVFYGLANWNANRWDWFDVTTDPVTLPSFDPYLSGTDDLVLAVAVIDDGTPTLDKIQLGPPPAVTEWTHSWGGDLNEWANTIASNGTDAVYCGGYCDSFGAGGSDAVLAKYSMDGTFQWARAWGGPSNEQYSQVVVADDGQVYAVGTTESYGEGNADLMIQGWSENGVLTWTRVWGTAEWENVRAMEISGGFLYIACQTTLPSLDAEIVLLKYDTGGNFFWAKSIGDDSDDFEAAICVTQPAENTDVIHLAFNLGIAPETTDLAYCEVGGDGTLQLEKVWQYADFEATTRDISVGPTGQVVISGSVDTSEGGKAMLLLEYSEDPGYLAREWYLEADGITAGYSLIFNDAGNLVVGGELTGVGSFSAGLLATVSPNGTLLGASALTSTGGQSGIFSLASAPSGAELFAGYCDAADNCSLTTTTLSSDDLSGTWADANLNFATFTGTQNLSTGSMVTDLTDGVQDSGGGSEDFLLGLAFAP